jgi:hypothetical protein
VTWSARDFNCVPVAIIGTRFSVCAVPSVRVKPFRLRSRAKVANYWLKICRFGYSAAGFQAKLCLIWSSLVFCLSSTFLWFVFHLFYRPALSIYVWLGYLNHKVPTLAFGPLDFTSSMVASYASTVPANLDPRIRRHHNPRPPIPASQQAVLQAKADEVNARKKAYVDEWWADTQARAQRMADEFDMTPRRALDLFQCAGMRMIHTRSNGNSWNAYLALKSMELKGRLSVSFSGVLGSLIHSQRPAQSLSTLLRCRKPILTNITLCPMSKRRNSSRSTAKSKTATRHFVDLPLKAASRMSPTQSAMLRD